MKNLKLLPGLRVERVFSPDITKQAIEIIHSVKTKKTLPVDLTFHGVPVVLEDYTQQLGVHLDCTLNFSKHISEISGHLGVYCYKSVILNWTQTSTIGKNEDKSVQVNKSMLFRVKFSVLSC